MGVDWCVIRGDRYKRHADWTEINRCMQKEEEDVDLYYHRLKESDIDTAPRTNNSCISTGLATTMPSPEPTPDTDVRYLIDLIYEDKLALETDYTARKEWLEWMMYTARQNKQCKALSFLYPAVKKRDVLPSALAYEGNYTCFIHRGRVKKVGTLM